MSLDPRLPVALSGFMGSGKSSVGEALARVTGRQFVDLDEELTHAFAAPPAAVFGREGESAFRDMEQRLLVQALALPGRVVALGGGTIVRAANREVLQRQATWVHLDVSLSEIRRRLQAVEEREGRPLWRSETVEQLHRAREVYGREAHLRVDGHGPPAAVSANLARRLGRWSGSRASRREALGRLEVKSSRGMYPIEIVHGDVEGLAERVVALGDGPVALLTDWTVGCLHADALVEAIEGLGRQVVRHTLPEGEEHKAVGAVVDALQRLLDRGWQRSAPVVALGGGVVGDESGLVASLMLRGVPLVQVPTTLLSMVDSSVGGKVGVNHRTGKNLIGAFYPPDLVWVDLAYLDTLPDRDFRAGLGEVVKSALIGDPVLWSLLESEPERLLTREAVAVAEVVRRCCAVKASVVQADEREAGWRRVLNLGHTVGHALEVSLGYGTLRHGEAVAIGLVAAAELAKARGKGHAAAPEKLRACLSGLGLPCAAPPAPRTSLRAALRTDKKLRGDSLSWILINGSGQPEFDQLSMSEVDEWLGHLAEVGVLQWTE